ncbi:hypothetical protein VNI00_009551 [Paramarasmius palmivorus]|uniref:Uncharacterized protein n=1 Tax=Paramarasmius palmivorus TaxID=297713 RepID=A0AAW0CSD4_9AGAR
MDAVESAIHTKDHTLEECELVKSKQMYHEWKSSLYLSIAFIFINSILYNASRHTPDPIARILFHIISFGIAFSAYAFFISMHFQEKYNFGKRPLDNDHVSRMRYPIPKISVVCSGVLLVFGFGVALGAIVTEKSL